MANKQSLIDAIAEALWWQCSATELSSVCESLGLNTKESFEDPFNSKRKYVRKLLIMKGNDDLLLLADKILTDYGDAKDAELSQEVNAHRGIYRPVEQLIFASIGHKPDITFDLINSKLHIVNPSGSLIYDQIIQSGQGVLLKDMENWWELKGESINISRRMYNSLQSEAEKRFYITYYRHFHPLFGEDLPALIPQVQFNYDPKTIKQLGGQKRISQRMDFLMFLPNKRAIFEIDGVQHYSESDSSGTRIAQPSIYAQMVEEDRKFRLAGYEVFRFGGYELRNYSIAEKTTVEFFVQYFKENNILT